MRRPTGAPRRWPRGGISPCSVRRIWKGHGLQPHRVRTFKISNDPKFPDKLKDVLGIFVDPPAHAMVLSIDEKSQIKALDRTQPGLPMKKGRCATMRWPTVFGYRLGSIAVTTRETVLPALGLGYVR